MKIKNTVTEFCSTLIAMINRRFYCIFIAVFIGAVVLIVHKNSKPTNNFDFTVVGYSSPLWTPELSNAFICLRKAFKDGTAFQAAYQWYYMPEATDECSKSVATMLNMETIKGEEDKFIIPGPTPDFSYTMLTLGIGHSVKAEELMLAAHPNCSRFVGVDPDPERNQDLVENLGGTFLKHAVAVDDNIGDASLLTKKGYRKIETQHTNLINVIKEAEMTDVIDILLMDIEGAEFGILLDMINNPKKYPTICQINTEIHSAFENGPNGFAIIDTLHKMALQSRYLLLKVTQYQFDKQVFNRCFFVNVKDEYCVKKYTNKLFKVDT